MSLPVEEDVKRESGGVTMTTDPDRLQDPGVSQLLHDEGGLDERGALRVVRLYTPDNRNRTRADWMNAGRLESLGFIHLTTETGRGRIG